MTNVSGGPKFFEALAKRVASIVETSWWPEVQELKRLKSLVDKSDLMHCDKCKRLREKTDYSICDICNRSYCCICQENFMSRCDNNNCRSVVCDECTDGEYLGQGCLNCIEPYCQARYCNDTINVIDREYILCGMCFERLLCDKHDSDSNDHEDSICIYCSHRNNRESSESSESSEIKN